MTTTTSVTRPVRTYTPLEPTRVGTVRPLDLFSSGVELVNPSYASEIGSPAGV